MQPEKSTNFSAGTVIRLGGLDLTVDGYYIKLRDQLGLSENIQVSSSQTAAVNAQIAALLAPYGVSAARFFINGIASHTKGIDAVAHYRLATPHVGAFDLTLAGNVNGVNVTRVPTSTSTLNPAPTLFARSRILTLEEGTPPTKVTAPSTGRSTKSGRWRASPIIRTSSSRARHRPATSRPATARSPTWRSATRRERGHRSGWASVTCSTPIPRRPSRRTTRPAWWVSPTIRRSGSTAAICTSVPA